MSKDFVQNQELLTISEFRRGQLDALKILEDHFFDLIDRGQKFYKAEQVANLVRSVRLNLEVVTD